MLAYHLHHAVTAEKFTKEVEERVPLGQLIPAQPQLQPQPEPEVMLAPEPEPLPQPQPLQITLLPLKIEIVESVISWKIRRMEEEERRREHEVMMEELRRICNDDIYE